VAVRFGVLDFELEILVENRVCPFDCFGLQRVSLDCFGQQRVFLIVSYRDVVVVVCRDFLGIYNLQPDPRRFWRIFFVFFTLCNIIDLGFIHLYVFFGLENLASEVELLFHGFMA
jgi:hypothetical protein